MGRNSYTAEIGKHPTKKVNINKKQLKNLYDKGLQYKEIGNIFGVSATTIGFHLRKHGIVVDRKKCVHVEPSKNLSVAKKHLIDGHEQRYCDNCGRWIWDSDWCD